MCLGKPISRMEITNNTTLSTSKLETMFQAATARWTAHRLKVAVRYSRGAVYSGTFASNPVRIYVNIDRKNHYPLKIETSIARARTTTYTWYKPMYSIYPANAYQLALLVFLHEFYHYLIHRARRNNRQKESMCDRFAVSHLVDGYHLKVYDSRGRSIDRSQWCFQDLEGFVSTRTKPAKRSAARRA